MVTAGITVACRGLVGMVLKVVYGYRRSAGMRHMFEGDVEAGKMHMQPMHAFMCAEVVLSPDRRRLDSLPMPSRLAVLSVVAMYLPYYAPQVPPPLLRGENFTRHLLGNLHNISHV